jgi:Cu-Zn family superoxide dismutase
MPMRPTTRRSLLAIAFLMLPVAAAVGGAPPARVTATLQSGRGEPVGEAVLSETPHGVLITATLHDLPPGEHGFHIHEHGRCIAPFESAGGHFNPKHARHGFRNAKGAHAGDLPNVIVPEDGKAKVEIMAYGVTLAKGKPSSLLDQDGTALVIHAGPDDYRTDPAGNSGDRLACGVVEVRTNETAAAATRPDRPTH